MKKVVYKFMNLNNNNNIIIKCYLLFYLLLNI